MKKRIAAALTLGVSLMMSTTALAGTWVDTYGEGVYWEYRNDDGTMAADTWVETDGKWYYLGAYGGMLKCSVTPDNCLVGKDGVWTGEKLDSGEVLDEDAAAAYQTIVQTSHNLQEYYLFDANKDGSPELFTKRGTCEADYMFYAYTYNGDRAVQAGSFAGGHGGLSTTRDGRLYREYGHMGLMGLCSVTWNGDTFIYNPQPVHEEYITEDNQYEDIMDRLGIYMLNSYSSNDLTPFN